MGLRPSRNNNNSVLGSQLATAYNTGGPGPVGTRPDRYVSNISPEAKASMLKGGAPTGNTVEQLSKNNSAGSPYAQPRSAAQIQTQSGINLTTPIQQQNTYSPSVSGTSSSVSNGLQSAISSEGAKFGVGTGTPKMITSLQQNGATDPNAYDTLGSRLVEQLQGAKRTQMEETANRLAALGFTGGQAASMLAKAERDYMGNMSQAVGQFNLDRLTQAAQVSKEFLELELARQLGMGNLELGRSNLDLQRYLGEGNLNLGAQSLAQQKALSEANLNLARELGQGNLALGYGELGLGYNQLGYNYDRLAYDKDELDKQVALQLATLAQSGDIQTRQQIEDLMKTYFGGNNYGANVNVIQG